MGKRARKTRWRALDIADDHSDSEESNTNSSAVSSRYSRSNSNGYYSNKYSYSSQSTPLRRRYNQYDGSSKSTRSSSTTSETKITFNEDEYTRITTPRQDVLFKKGYLNKPKVYQTQTSTGNSIISTGTSTENGTPDHQSTDLDYESQFMFPNGFVDQNGIYYVNSYEPYPLMLFNPPTYYQEFSNSKTKRYSTGSLSESMSPNNEEATSQDLSQSGGEASISGVSDYSGGPHVFNMVYPGYYVNGACTPTGLTNGHHCPTEPVKTLKKRRERKSSKTIPGDSSEYTDENSEDETSESTSLNRVSIPEKVPQEVGESRVEKPPPSAAQNDSETSHQENNNVDDLLKTANSEANNSNNDQSISNGCADKKTDVNEQTPDDVQAKPQPEPQKHSILKPDAEEFIPRGYHPVGPPPHLKMMPPNFMPIPLVPIGEFGAQNFAPHPAFIPQGIPIPFIPHHLGQKIYPPLPPTYVSYNPPIFHETKIEEKCETNEDQTPCDDREKESTAAPSHTPVVMEEKPQIHSTAIDIATVVSKLEAVKQKERHDVSVAPEETPKSTSNEPSSFRSTHHTPILSKPQNYKRNYYNKYRNPPSRDEGFPIQIVQNNFETKQYNGAKHLKSSTKVVEFPSSESSINIGYRNSPVRHLEQPQVIKPVEILQKPSTNGTEIPVTPNYNNTRYSKQIRNSPERFEKKNWKPNGYQNGYFSNHSSPKRTSNLYQKPISNGIEKPVITNGNADINKNEEQVKQKLNSQWISVSRKKKKNKNLEDDCNEIEIDDANGSTDTTSDLFESYDINQLIDVVPPSQTDTQTAEPENKRIEDILSSIARTESFEVLAKGQKTPTDVNIPEVSDIEKDIIVKIEEKVDLSEENLAACLQADEKSLEIPEGEESVEEEAFKPKKKSKKGTQKPLTKKVIITDVFKDLSLDPVEPKTPLEKGEKDAEELKTAPAETILHHSKTEPQSIQTKEATPEAEAELPEKKSKKKKKNKSSKSLISANKNVPDELCDVLLESSFAGENLEGTSDDISFELDKLIQRGMYGSIQEKIKSLQPETDDFFKTIDAVATTPSKDKPTSTLKALDFNKIFQSTRQFLKPNMTLPIRALDLL